MVLFPVRKFGRRGRMSAHNKVEYVSVSKGDREAVVLGPLQLRKSDGLTALVGQTAGQLAYDTTTDEICLSDSHDGKFHPVRAPPCIILSKSGAQSCNASTWTKITFGAADIDYQHNVGFDDTNDRLLLPKWAGQPISVVELTFTAYASPNNMADVHVDGNGVPDGAGHSVYRVDLEAATTLQHVTTYPVSSLYINHTRSGPIQVDAVRWAVVFPGHGGLYEGTDNDYLQS